MKPEIVEALSPQKSGLMRDKPSRANQPQQPLVDTHQVNEFPGNSNVEDAAETPQLRRPGLRTRKIPKDRRNKFTSRFSTFLK